MLIYSSFKTAHINMCKLLEQIDHTHAKKMNESKREREREKVGENSVY
jgi:hypothetical protein